MQRPHQDSLDCMGLRCRCHYRFRCRCRHLSWGIRRFRCRQDIRIRGRQ
ncbi:hypothetical protein PoMZ_09851 [Pyricularia oryzae]|uniref:Uncharacterized protein n=1 Tax=Pyricularia oryzae TaxID=318829 RepID=A0A4P7MVK1_PYROR|nr:hypothetical protein PoMZ_09851 [Pyricularia oryzae]